MLQNLLKCNIGYRISQRQVWMDLGIFPSRIGYETAESRDNPILTQSLSTDNSPYFETGIRMSYLSCNKKLMLAILPISRWQRIAFRPGNSLLGCATQVQFKSSEHAVFNYSTFIETDAPDTSRVIRYYHNLYGRQPVGKVWELVTGIDIGMQQAGEGSKQYSLWFSPLGVIQSVSFRPFFGSFQS